MTKSSTFNEHNNQPNNLFNYININDNDILINNNIPLQKSMSCQENEVFQRQCFTLGFNNINRNHLETVVETLSEVSNSKADSSELNNKNEDNENSGKNETKETTKNKEESCNINSEQKNSGLDIKINERDNFTPKKSLFLS